MFTRQGADLNSRQYIPFHLHRAPAFVSFAFIVPMFVEKHLMSNNIELFWGSLFLICSFVATALLLFIVPFFRALFKGYLAFKFVAILLFLLTLIPSFFLPLFINNEVLNSSKNVIFIVGLLANFLWYTFYCREKYMSNIGWVAKNDEPW